MVVTSHVPPPLEMVDELRSLGIDVDDDARRLAEYSYDASNYRVRPAAVVFPRAPEQVVSTLKAAYDRGVPVTARGGGTSMAGNAIGSGIVLDFSRFSTEIRRIDAESRTATVDAGVVLATLQAVVEQETNGELTFAPDPSSRNRATVGGSIGNDACGNHSVRDGRMSDHVVALDVVTADGQRLTATADDLRATLDGDDLAERRAAILKAQLRALRSAYTDELRGELERIPRQVSGYHLSHLLPEKGFNVARALVGSEGTCVVIVSATVRLVPRPAESLLIIAGYDDVVAAARDVPAILHHQPAAVEGIDRAIMESVKTLRGDDAVGALPRGDAWLYIELSGASKTELDERARMLINSLRKLNRALEIRPVPEPAERAALWRVREDGAGLSARLSTGVESWPGWEDSAVAPERLADYLAELRVLIDSYGLDGVMYGHFGAGCMHIRLTFDLRSASGRQIMRDFTREAASLVSRHGGSLSGEHGDGRARSELLPLMYSAGLIRAFAEFKDIWDPTKTLNPGSIVEPVAIDADLALSGVPERDWRTSFALHPRAKGASGGGFVQAVQGCVGIGRCRSHSGGVMCPSFRATGDEKDSTRGRARVLQEMVRGARTVEEGWKSREVREVLDLCLSCKACSTDCPTGVDMATYKAEFLDHHYRGRLRPVSHYSLGWLPLWLKILGRIAPLVNVVMSSALRPLAARLAGVSRHRVFPRFASHRAWRRAAPELRHGPDSDADVVLFADTFTRAFRPQVVGAAERVLQAAGRTSECRSDACCGLTWISTGQLNIARRKLTALAAALDDGTDRRIVVLEPSCASAMRKDLPELVDSPAARRVSQRVRSFAAEIVDIAAEGREPDWGDEGAPREVTLQAHCHEYAVFGAAVQSKALRAIGVEQVRQAEGCCGVAGNFGFEAEHFDVSMAVARLGLEPALAKTASQTPVLADGFSCQLQVTQLDDRRTPLHLAELIDHHAPGAFRHDRGEAT